MIHRSLVRIDFRVWYCIPVFPMESKINITRIEKGELLNMMHRSILDNMSYTKHCKRFWTILPGILLMLRRGRCAVRWSGLQREDSLHCFCSTYRTRNLLIRSQAPYRWANRTFV